MDLGNFAFHRPMLKVSKMCRHIVQTLLFTFSMFANV